MGRTDGNEDVKDHDATVVEELKEAARDAISAAESLGHPQAGGGAQKRASEAEAELQKAIERMSAALAEARAECLEQARLLGMGAERELSLTGQLEEANRLAAGRLEQMQLDRAQALRWRDEADAVRKNSHGHSQPVAWVSAESLKWLFDPSRGETASVTTTLYKTQVEGSVGLRHEVPQSD